MWEGDLVLSLSPLRGTTPATLVYVVREPLVFTSSKFRVEVYPGLRTDGASVPRFLWWWTDPFYGSHAPAAVIHDGLYSAQLTTRAEADRIFYEAMRESGVRWTQATAMYLGVRLGGWLPWRNHRRNAENIRGSRRHVTAVLRGLGGQYAS